MQGEISWRHPKESKHHEWVCLEECAVGASDEESAIRGTDQAVVIKRLDQSVGSPCRDCPGGSVRGTQQRDGACDSEEQAVAIGYFDEPFDGSGVMDSPMRSRWRNSW